MSRKVDPPPSDVKEVADADDDASAMTAYEVVEHASDPSSLNAGPRTPNRQSVPHPDELRRRLGGHVCPFCGHKNADGRSACGSCGMEDAETTRSATVRRIGPWFLRMPGNPHAPGMKFAVLRELTKGGGVLPDSVVRGPTTKQMWTYAARIRGLAHMFGLCWNCNRHLPAPARGEDPDDFCLYCGALVEPPGNPDQQLEVAETSEALGMAVPGNASQAPRLSTSPVEPRAALPRGTGRRQASVRGEMGKAAAHPGAAKRVEAHASSLKPTKPVKAPTRVGTRAVKRPADVTDGGDALLTTNELATAFNLDRRGGGWSLLGRLPLVWIVVLLVLTAAAAAAVFIGVDRLREAAGF